MPFPISEINMGGTFAFILTLNNQLKVIRVVPIFGRLFYVADLGFFLLHEDFRYITKNGRSEIYFFTQKGCNPISLAGIVDVKKQLDAEKRKQLELRDLAIYVEKIRRVEIGKALIERMKADIRNQQANQEAPLTEQEQMEILNGILLDANFDYTVEKANDLARPRPESSKLNEVTIAWLNAYFNEDPVSRYYLHIRQIIDAKSKLKESKPISGALSFMGPSMGKKSIAIVCINNAVIDFDTKIKVEMNDEKGHAELKSKAYNLTLDIKDAKTRMKFGKQSLYLVMVQTSKGAKPKVDEKKDDPVVVMNPPVPQEVPAINELPAEQTAQVVTAPTPIKRGRGRPRKIAEPTITAQASTHEGPTVDQSEVVGQ